VTRAWGYPLFGSMIAKLCPIFAQLISIRFKYPIKTIKFMGSGKALLCKGRFIAAFHKARTNPKKRLYTFIANTMRLQAATHHPS